MILDTPAQLGLRPGEDIGVASLDVIFQGTQCPNYAGVDQQPQVQGATAVDIVVSDLQRNEFGLPAIRASPSSAASGSMARRSAGTAVR